MHVFSSPLEMAYTAIRGQHQIKRSGARQLRTLHHIKSELISPLMTVVRYVLTGQSYIVGKGRIIEHGAHDQP